MLTAADVANWSNPAQAASLSFDDATLAFHDLGPRARFIRTLPPNAALLDAGAGDGSTIIFRSWPGPARPDVKMYAWAGEAGSRFGDFDGSEVGYWPEQPPNFGGRKFDAIFSGHFLEHIPDPLRFVEWAAERLSRRGRIYLEWPSEASMQAPTRSELEAVGVQVTTGRFDDDSTHQYQTPPLGDVAVRLKSLGLSIVETGAASVPYIDQQLAIHARQRSDLVAMTLAYWSYARWSQYLIAEAV